MTARTPQPAFPIFRAVAALSLLALALGALCAYAVPAMFGRPDGAARGTLVMAGVVWFSLVLSVLPVGLVGPLGVMPTVFAYFGGAGARMVLCLVAAVVLVKSKGLPAAPVMVTLAIVYLPLMFVEAGMVGRYLWKKDSLAPAGSLTPPRA